MVITPDNSEDSRKDSHQSFPEKTSDYRAGFVALVGRPNTGKSSLVNALLGKKVVITSSKPQTTRRNIRAIVTDDKHQLILEDTPGAHRPRTLLGQHLNDLVENSLLEVDVIAICISANEDIGPGDRHIVERINRNRIKHRGQSSTPVIAIVTKIDTVSDGQLASKLSHIEEFGRQALPQNTAKNISEGFNEIIPVSSLKFAQVDVVQNVLSEYLPLSPILFPDEEITDQDVQQHISELIREATLEEVRDELPHSIAVVIDEMQDREGNVKKFTDIWASLIIERPSQKRIVVGKGGSHIKSIGIKARKEIEQFLGHRVNLDLHVKVVKEWQSDQKKMERLGFYQY